MCLFIFGFLKINTSLNCCDVIHYFMYAHIYLYVEDIHTAICVYLERYVHCICTLLNRYMIYIKITDSIRRFWHIKEKVDLTTPEKFPLPL